MGVHAEGWILFEQVWANLSSNPIHITQFEPELQCHWKIAHQVMVSTEE